MKPEEQRIAIAEACGWTFIEMGKDSEDTPPAKLWTSPTASKWEGAVWRSPDYLTDLNAMHEAEKTLTGEQRISFYDCIEALTARSGNGYHHEISAPATHRAEAFLRAVDRWTDSPQ